MSAQLHLRPAPARHGRNSLERALGELANEKFQRGLEQQHHARVVALLKKRVSELEKQVAGLSAGFHK